MPTIKLEVVSPDAVVYQADIHMLVVKAEDGENRAGCVRIVAADGRGRPYSNRKSRTRRPARSRAGSPVN